jgi:hypothetical protein
MVMRVHGAGTQMQGAAGNDHVSTGGHYVHMIGLNRELVHDLGHRHRRNPRQDVGKSTGMGRHEMGGALFTTLAYAWHRSKGP